MNFSTFVVHRILQMILFGLMLAAVPTVNAVAGSDLPAQYLCGPLQLFVNGQVPPMNWSMSAHGEVTVKPMQTCWMQLDLTDPPSALDETKYVRFGLEQGLEIALFDDMERPLGAITQDGYRARGIASQYLAFFPMTAGTPTRIYVQVRSFNPLYSVRVSADQSIDRQEIMGAQMRDAVSMSLMMALLAIGLIAVLLAPLQHDRVYWLFSAYALLTAIHVFGNYGVSLPFGINTANYVSLIAEPASILALAVLVMRVGHFARHSPWSQRALMAIVGFTGVQIIWLMLMWLGALAPTAASERYFLIQYDVTGVLTFAMAWGGFVSWRRGDKLGLWLALGTLPRTMLFIAHSPAISPLIGGEPDGFGFTEIGGIVGLLALPTFFLIGIARRNHEMHAAALKLATHDQLTGLPNRDEFIRLGHHLLSRRQPFLLLVLSIGRFKAINDVLGYDLGDAVMVKVGQRLSGLPDVMVGRTQGTQFCVLCTRDIALSELQQEVDNLFSKPVVIWDHALDISLTIGVARNAAQSMSALMRNAETAHSEAKQSRKTWVIFQDSMTNPRPENLSLLSELITAAHGGQLVLYIQPKVWLQDGSVKSAEALVRWQHPSRGLLPPNDFIPLAEQTGKIELVTRWVLQEGAHLAAQWRRAGRPVLLSVNVSTHDLRNASFVEQVCALVALGGAEPGDIRLEVTESTVMDDPDTSLRVLHALRAAGFSISIDDFGTGYSSLAYLQKMPVAELKIDRSFVSHVHAGSDGVALLDSIVTLGHRLGLTVVAEGAETRQEWDLLAQLGCDYVQGWFVAKAMPVSEFNAWRATHDPFIAAPVSA